MNEVQKWPEQESNIPTLSDMEKSADVAGKTPEEVTRALQNDPEKRVVLKKILGVVSGIGEWTIKGATSAFEGTKSMLVGTGEFIGVWAAKLVHEWGDSFMQYTDEKTQGIRDVVNVAGEAIAVTAFEAVNGDHSVIQGAVDYWKGKGIEFGELPAEKQAELIASFATQAALAVVGSKGLGAASKTATLSSEINVGGKVLDKTVSIGAKIGTEVAGLDSGALKKADVPGTAMPEKVAKAEARSWVSHETVMRNAGLPDNERLELAERIVGTELKQNQKDTILHLHNDVSKGVYQNGHLELRTMVKELDRVGIPREKTRELMENGVLGSAQTLQDQMARFHNLDYLRSPGLPRSGVDRASARSNMVSDQMQQFQNSDLLQRLDSQPSGNNTMPSSFRENVLSVVGRLASGVDDIIAKSSAERGVILKEASSETLTREGLEAIKTKLQAHIRSVGEKLTDIHNLSREMNKSGANYSSEAKEKVRSAQSRLQNEFDSAKNSVHWSEMTQTETRIQEMEEKQRKESILRQRERDVPAKEMIVQKVEDRPAQVSLKEEIWANDFSTLRNSFKEPPPEGISESLWKEKSTDYYRLRTLLAVLPETKGLGSNVIASRLWAENIDLFFSESFPRLEKDIQDKPWLRKDLGKILTRYKVEK